MTQTHVRFSAPSLTYRWLWQTIGWLGVLIIIALSLIPQPPSLPEPFSWDKFQHVLAYAVLMWWFRQAFTSRKLWAYMLLLLGVGLEGLQGLTSYRSLAYGDMVANALGVGCGIALASTPLGRAVNLFDRLMRRLIVGQ
jgi:hypothetical protein